MPPTLINVPANTCGMCLSFMKKSSVQPPHTDKQKSALCFASPWPLMRNLALVARRQALCSILCGNHTRRARACQGFFRARGVQRAGVLHPSGHCGIPIHRRCGGRGREGLSTAMPQPQRAKKQRRPGLCPGAAACVGTCSLSHRPKRFTASGWVRCKHALSARHPAYTGPLRPCQTAPSW